MRFSSLLQKLPNLLVRQQHTNVCVMLPISWELVADHAMERLVRPTSLSSSGRSVHTSMFSARLSSFDRRHSYVVQAQALNGEREPDRKTAALPLRVYAPTQQGLTTLSDSRMATVDFQSAVPGPVTIAEVTAPAKAEMEQLLINLKNVVGERHPLLMAAADQIFGAGGKRLRPLIVFLIGKATMAIQGTSELTDRHKRLAEITEMIHTASLMHDDVLDDCNVRRGQDTVNKLYGTRVAVLAGDFLFAQSSWGLANLDNLEVIKLISQVIADFANGEISQALSLFDTELTLHQYLDKSFYKTASLIAASCRSAAVFSGADEEVKQAMYDYGKHLGLAFQVVDDILDFTQSTEQLGKPQGQDLSSGNLTAPALFALKSDEVGQRLEDLIQSEFTEDGSLDQALEYIKRGGGIEAARTLARQEADMALAALECLPPSPSKDALVRMVDYVLDRLH